jgi:hypothetical protein
VWCPVKHQGQLLSFKRINVLLFILNPACLMCKSNGRTCSSWLVGHRVVNVRLLL